MKLPRRSGILALASVTAAVLGLLVWGLLQDPAGPWQRLPDGSSARVLGVSYGTEHRASSGRVWQLLLQALHLAEISTTTRSNNGFPALQSSTSITASRSLRLSSNRPLLAVWLECRTQAAGGGLRTFECVDEHGCRYPGELLWNGDTVEVLLFENFPRRSPTARVRLIDPYLPEAKRPTLSVTLPDPKPAPAWTARPLPQPVTSGPLTLALTGWTPRRPIPTAEFEVRERGKPTTGWEPVTLTVSDSTGNSHTSLREHEYEPDPRRLGFPGLCRREPAWKLHAEFAPTLPSRPAANRLDSNWSPAPKAAPSWRWSATLQPPAPNRPTTTGPRLARPELGLELLAAASPGPVSTDAWGANRLRCSAVRVRMTGNPETLRLTLARVTDERGRSAVPQWQESPLELQWDLALPRPSHLFRPGTTERNFVLPDLPGARTLKLEFVAHRVRTADFLVAPP
jgi:hypothetical protein